MKRIFALTTGLLLVASLAVARDIDEDTIEIAGSSSGGVASIPAGEGSETRVNLGVAGYYYLATNTGLGGVFAYESLGGDNRMTLGVEGIYQREIHDDVNAYAAAGLAFNAVNGNDATGISLGVSGGVKYFFARSASLNCGLSLSHLFGDFDETVIGAAFGLSLYLR